MLPLFAIACATVLEVAPNVKQPQSLQSPEEPVLSDGSATENITTSEEKGQQAHQRSKMEIIKNPVFVLLALGIGIGYLGLFMPIFYVSSYSAVQGIGAELSFYLTSMLNGSSLFGRVVSGYMADHYGHFNLCLLMLLISGVIAFCWTSASSVVGLILWSIAYGFSSGVSV
jgi:cyanate permease